MRSNRCSSASRSDPLDQSAKEAHERLWLQSKIDESLRFGRVSRNFQLTNEGKVDGAATGRELDDLARKTRRTHIGSVRSFEIDRVLLTRYIPCNGVPQDLLTRVISSNNISEIDLGASLSEAAKSETDRILQLFSALLSGFRRELEVIRRNEKVH
jgi:hypothetical protein